MQEIIFTCPFIPAEFIAAHGVTSRRIRLRHTVADNILDRTEGLCPFAQAWTNEVIANTGCLGAIFTTACDQMRRAYEIAATRSNTPTFLMNVPSTWQSSESTQLYIDELNRLARWLCSLGAKTPSKDALSKAMIQHDKDRRHDTLPAAANDNAIPLAIVAGPMLKSGYDIIAAIEKYGGRIVLDATDTGERTMPGHLDRQKLKDDPLSELARAYLHHIPAAWKRPNGQLFDWLRQKCSERKVRGIIFHRFVFCDIWHGELYRLRRTLPVPVLDIDVTDDSASTAERTTTRIQAFMETLQ